MRLACFFALLLTLLACTPREEPRVWQTIEKSLQTQLILLADGDTLTLPAGHYRFSKSLTLEGKKNVVIRGQGIHETILSWKDQAEGAEGFHVSRGTRIVLQDFTIEDARGDNLKVSDTQGIALRRIRSRWTAGPRTENGAYALYPVLCKNVLIEDCEASGSSDAGIYVGQSDSVTIRYNRAFHNVAGIEAENCRWVEIYGNEAHDNTGGLLVFDLPGLTQYGHSTRVYQNHLHHNNHQNFAQKGNIVASIPPGCGMMVLATHGLEVFDNDFEHNRSVGLAVVSYELVAALNERETEQPGSIGGVQTVNNRFREDSLYNPYPYRIAVHHNRFINRYWFPTWRHDIGKLLTMKSMFRPPDVVYDGIADPNRPEREICLAENGTITFINLDAGNDFRDLSKDAAPFFCLPTL